MAASQKEPEASLADWYQLPALALALALKNTAAHAKALAFDFLIYLICVSNRVLLLALMLASFLMAPCPEVIQTLANVTQRTLIS